MGNVGHEVHQVFHAGDGGDLGGLEAFLRHFVVAFVEAPLVLQ